MKDKDQNRRLPSLLSIHTFYQSNLLTQSYPTKTEKQSDLIMQENIQEFVLNKFMVFNYLLIINKLMHPGTFSAVATYHLQLPNMQATRQHILAQYLSDTPYNPQFQGNYFNLLTLKLNTPILSAFFVADKGFLKLYGDVCFEDDNSLIVCVHMLRHNTKLYFGTGIKDIAVMVEKVRKASKKVNEKV